MTPLDYQSWIGRLGPMVIAARGEALAGVWFQGQKYFPAIRVENGWREQMTPVLEQTIAQLRAYFDGELQKFHLSLDPGGTDFQRAVWDALLRVPYGETTTYGRLACGLGSPQSAHAVGAAVGRNPISVIIPCHRALGSTGGLTGYAGGLVRKVRLLEMERGQLRMRDQTGSEF